MALEDSFNQMLELLRQPVKNPADVLHGRAAFGQEPIQRFASEALQHPGRENAEWVQRGADAIAQLDDFNAGRLSRILGALVERNAPADALARALSRRLPQLLERVERLIVAADLRGSREGSEERLARASLQDPESFIAWAGLEHLGIAARTALARSPGTLTEAIADAPLRAALARTGIFHAAAAELRELLEALRDTELLLIFPLERRGMRLRADNVRTHYQLFSLIQCAVLHQPLPPAAIHRGPIELVDWGDPHTEACRAARGRISARPNTEDSSVWRFYSWDAWTGSELDATRQLEGEALPGLWPLLEGERVMLAGPVQGDRETWDGAFLDRIHVEWRSSVTVTAPLGLAEVDARLERIKAHAG